MNGDVDLTWKSIGSLAADLFQKLAPKPAKGGAK